MSSCEEDVQRIKKKLEKMLKGNEIDVSTSIDMLNVLKNLPINLQVLQNTRIGVVVNSLRKASNSDELGTVAKNLLKSWKRLVSGDNNGSGSGGAGGGNNPVSPNSNSNFDDRENSNSAKSPPPQLQQQVSTMSRQSSIDSTISSSTITSTMSTTTTPASLGRTSSSGTLSNSSQLSADKKSSSFPSTSNNNANKPIQVHYSKTVSYENTNDIIRVKSRELIEQALQLTEQIDKNIPLYDAHAIACRCEDVIFKEFGNTDNKYKTRIRSRIANLKDPKNPKLRENVLMGLISPEKLATMTAEEMASDELRLLREKFTKEAIDDHRMAQAPTAKSSLLKCGKCKKTNCGYREMQTRSADEPMTVFAFCNDCGHRWKFG